MRSSKVVSITMPPDMAQQAEQLAKRENRTMSELMREAFRLYKRERDWNRANTYGRGKAKQMGITEVDVVRLIKEFRAEESAPGPRRGKTGS